MGDPAAETSEPTADESTDGEVAETEGAEGEESESEGEEQTEQANPFLASLSSEEHAYYAKRYPTLYKAAQDPNQPDDLRQAFTDRVNQDREFEKLRSRAGDEDEGPTLDDESEESASQPDQATQRVAYYKEVDAVVNTVLDKQAIEEMGMNLLKGFGVDTTSKDPEVQALIKNAPTVGRELARGAVDIIATVLPSMLNRTDEEGVSYLGRMIDSIFPGTLENFERQQYQSAWDQVRNSDPSYKDFPAYGKADSDFGKFVREQAAKIPNFDKIRFDGTKAEQAAAKYALLAKVGSGQKATPAVVAQAVESGKRQAAEKTRRVVAGRAMGSGQSSQEFSSTKEDPMMDDLDAEINRQNANFQPFNKGKK